MTRTRPVCVVGGGRMATAYARVLAAADVELRRPDDDLGGCDVLSAAFDGQSTLAGLEALDLHGVRAVVDLATQSCADARATEAACRRWRVDYFAGGVTGGATQVGSADFTIILGPICGARQPPAWLEAIGSLIHQSTVAAAVSAKLLHNLVLIVSNHALGAALQLAEEAEVVDFLSILAGGTAGRPIAAASTVRDRAHGASSSYSAALVAKDLRAILRSLPALDEVRGLDLARLASAYAARGHEPYTRFANTQFSDRRGR